MLYVTSLDGSQVEPLVNIGTDFKMEQSTDGTFIVSFSCFPQNNPGYELLKSRSVVNVDGYDFRVLQYNPTKFSKNVIALSVFFDNRKVRQNNIFSGSHTLQNHLSFALAPTGWAFTIDSTIASGINYIDKFGNDNVVSLVTKICKYHRCEYVILPGKRIHFAKKVGGYYDYQYRYKHNVSDVVLKEDTTNLYTFIRGFGADGLEISYTSPNASIFGTLEAEPIEDARFTDATALSNYIASQIQDEPELAIESSIPELTEREIGESVWLIYDPLGIEMQTRILKQTKILRNRKLITASVLLGNTLIKTSTDLLVEQQEKLDDTNDYIEDTKEELTEAIDETKEDLEDAKGEYRSRFEKTDDRITLEVEQLEKSIAIIDIKADNINLSVNNRITKEIASINIRADTIELIVENLDSELSSKITQTATQIRAEVTDVKNNLQSSITQTASQIRSEVSAQVTTINNNIQTVRNDVSTVTQTAAQIQSTVYAQTSEISSLGTRVSTAESSITQTAAAVTSKVSKTDYNGNTLVSMINQTASSISIQASKINLVGAVSVLSDISGDLGTITSANINITQDINMGRRLRFSDMTSISGGDGSIRLEAFNDIIHTGLSHVFWGKVDFSNATIIGL